jgi:class 3 adenylate cyclase
MEREVPIPRTKVWELLSNTDHLDRVIGLFPISFEPARMTAQGTIVRSIAAKVAGWIPLRWEERPFEWTKYREYLSVREYSGSVMRKFEGGILLEDGNSTLPDGERSTQIRIYARFTPAGPLGLLAIPLVGKRSIVRTFKFVERYEKASPAQGADYLPQRRNEFPVNKRELERAADELAARFGSEKLGSGKTGSSKLLDKLQEHLVTRGDEEVLNMRPYVLADRWGEGRDESVRLFLHAAAVGMLNLSWNLICPNCRVPKVSADSMRAVSSAFHCDFCGINYNARLDNYVELRFSVHSQIRKAESNTFCIGSPSMAPHIFEQRRVEAGETRPIALPGRSGNWRIRVLKRNHLLALPGVEHVDGANVSASSTPREYKVTYHGDSWLPTRLEGLRAGDVLQVTNASDKEILIALEAEQWDDAIVTAAKVTVMPEFRRMFSSEVLAPGEQVGIDNISLLFSDLLGSTQFYEQVGDAFAYGQVRKHFDFMRYWIEQSGGSIVKTIGDAVMAVFETPEQSLRAALGIQRHVGGFNAGLPQGQEIVVKIGLHHGPAIAVTSNEVLDYFGRTVNMAARIQNESAGGDIVLSEECVQREEVARLLVSEGIELTHESVRLKGIDGDVRIVRAIVRRIAAEHRESDRSA